MECEGCIKRVKNKLNNISEVLECDVTLTEAFVVLKKNISFDILKQQIESLGFTVTNIEDINHNKMV